MKREEVMKAEENFPISEQGFVMGKLMNGEECQYYWIWEQVSHICPSPII